MKKNWLLGLLIVLVLVDLALTYVQNQYLAIDGDFSAIVVPRADYAYILHDPFGWRVLTTGGWYAAPNRFFSHIIMREYCIYAPLALQVFMSPIESVYTSIALLNTLAQALLLYVLGWYATGTRRLGDWRLWLAMALMSPFFQMTGYNGQMAIIDNAFTYNFFYAFPLLALLVLLWPLYQAARQQQPMRVAWPKLVAMLLLSVVLSFSGPIIGGTIMVTLLGVGVYTLRQRWRQPAATKMPLPWQALLLWSWLGILCVYSFYIGRHNTENLLAMLPLVKRFQLVPYGVFDELTTKLGLPLLVLGCVVNGQLISRLLPPTTEGRRIRLVLRWLGWFALVYVMLLPLGGYRSYRPVILRHDSIIPVTISLIGFYALSASYLVGQLRGRAQRWYLTGLVAVAVIFVNADRRLQPRNSNVGERKALAMLAQAGPEPVVRLPYKCSVLSWEPVARPYESLTNAELLKIWRITKNQNPYYSAP